MAITTLLESAKVTSVSDDVAAGVTLVQSARVDMAGFDGVLFLVKIGTIVATGVVEITAHQAPTDAAGAELTGSKITLDDTGDDQVYLLDVRDPDDRYLSIEVARTIANSEVDSIVALQYRADDLPVSQTAGTYTSVVRAAEV